MLIAAMTADDGRKTLVLGLLAENVEKLVNDKPIYKRLDGERDSSGSEGVLVEGLEGWDVTILGPEDTARFVAHFAPGATP